MHSKFGKIHPTVTKDSILGFFAEYRFLSNFHLCDIVIDGLVYPSSEHAYMAQKTGDIEIKRLFTDRKLTPAQAKHLGNSIKIRNDWDNVRVDMMYKVVLEKFIQNEYLAILLDETGEKYLEETNYWKDVFWGKCGGVGENNLGIVLMSVRDFIRGKYD